MVKTVHRRAMEHALIPLLRTKNWGRCLDVGSKDSRYKKFMRYTSFETLDLEPSFHPDYVGNIEFWQPSDGKLYDTIIMTQVLEHVKNPEIVLKNIASLLKTGGVLIMTTPFIFQEHGDEDYWRWTSKGLRLLLERYFREIRIDGYSNFIASSFDVFHFHNRIPFVNPIVEFVSRIFGSHHCPCGYLTQAIK